MPAAGPGWSCRSRRATVPREPGGRAPRPHRVLVALQAQVAGRAGQAGDVGDPAVSEVEQVPDRERRAEVVVVGEDIDVGQTGGHTPYGEGRDRAGHR